MAYKTDLITASTVRRVLELAGKSGLRQPDMLDALRGPLEYRVADGVDETGNAYTKGDVIPRPHEDLERALREMKLAGTASFSKQVGGWILVR